MSDEVKVAEAVASASAAGRNGLGRMIEQAMTDAVNAAYADGHADDPEKVREYMTIARDEAKERWRIEQAAKEYEAEQ